MTQQTIPDKHPWHLPRLIAAWVVAAVFGIVVTVWVPGEARFQWEGRWLCPDCFRAAVNKALNDCPEQVAQEMGLEVERYV